MPTPKPGPPPDSPEDIAIVEDAIQEIMDIERETVLAFITAKTYIVTNVPSVTVKYR